MVVSLAVAPVPLYTAIAGACGSTIASTHHNNEADGKVKLSTFLRIDSRGVPFYGLKADVHFLSSKRWRYTLLTCVALDKGWSQKRSGDSGFKPLVEHTYRTAASLVSEATGKEKSFEATVATGSTPSSSWDYANSSRVLGASRFAVLLGVVITIFGAVSLTAVLFGRWWNRLRNQDRNDLKTSDSWPGGVASPSVVFEAPSAFSFFLKKDLKRKESVEWVNMVLGKLWKIYRRGLETWLVGLLQPLIDNLHKPSYVRRVVIQHFHLGDEPLTVRSVERRTSRRANDLQYHIGLRYTGEAKMRLMITLSAGFLPVMIPVGVRGFDVDGEIWVKLRLVPSEPWIGTATWAFVSLPKIILALAPFGLFNIMTFPFISRFLTKLLTEDLPQLFVRPNKIVVNFLKNPASGPFAQQFQDEGVNVEGSKDFTGELSVTLMDARKLKYFPIGKTDPYVKLMLGDQVIRSKKNSQTSIIGPPGAPIWNQDFQLLVEDPKTQKVAVRVRDAVGLGVFTIGYGEIDLSTLQDTVPVDKIVTLRGGWGFPKRFAGEIMVRLTYKAYVEDDEEEDDGPFNQLSDVELDSDKDEFSTRKFFRKKRRLDFLRDLFAAVNVVIKDFGYDNVLVEPKKFVDKKREHAQGDGHRGSSQSEPRRHGDTGRLPPSKAKHRQVPPSQSDDGAGKKSQEVTDQGNLQEPRPDIPAQTPEAEKEQAEKEQAEETRRTSLNSGGGRTKASGRWTENPAVLWLGLATGIALLAALSLNFSNLVNP
ncbi:integral membrane single C2 domain protein [Selaginella moellendorffii]|uniref:Integral membrane single C2 domain protein n=1 Tax=Selaginella moellendorffii TaxID=88036 RepID=D8SXX9_SELML|nr:tricalbin-3 [Selaginella moellendorffii]EFJ10603.1 integral membrane single C2 domain protein [Selaginella moellendorffii]|eukprot:XP_002988184.1 tricalbin-3 [Selaginella moellendorffii]